MAERRMMSKKINTIVCTDRIIMINEDGNVRDTFKEGKNNG